MSFSLSATCMNVARVPSEPMPLKPLLGESLTPTLERGKDVLTAFRISARIVKRDEASSPYLSVRTFEQSWRKVSTH